MRVGVGFPEPIPPFIVAEDAFKPRGGDTNQLTVECELRLNRIGLIVFHKKVSKSFSLNPFEPVLEISYKA